MQQGEWLPCQDFVIYLFRGGVAYILGGKKHLDKADLNPF